MFSNRCYPNEQVLKSKTLVSQQAKKDRTTVTTPTNAAKAQQKKQAQRDRATVQAEARKVNSQQTSETDKAKAIAMLSRTVLRGTGFGTTGNSFEMLGKLTADLCANPGTVIGLGIEDAIKLKVSAEDAAIIPQKVVDRLKKLV